MKSFLEARGDTAVFTFGRFNPPTTGHEKLIDALAREQGKNPGAPMYVYPSHSQNAKKDPLPHNKKVAYMKKMFPKYKKDIKVSRARNVFDIAVELHNKGHKAVVMVVGSDRVDEFDNLLNKYNGVDGRHGYYGFDEIKVVSAGERDPDAEGVTGMSASKMRAAAQSNDFEQFKLGLPKGFTDGEKLFNDVRKFMGIKEEFNLTMEELNRDLYIRGEIWNVGDIVKTTDGNEGTIIRKGTNYVVFEDLRRVWLHNLEEVRKTKQDKDVEDREGTQPAKYYAKGAGGKTMKKSTKQSRARHFEKGAKMDDDNPAAYKPAPGDKGAKTKLSKYTKKYRQMYGETEESLWANIHKKRERIKQGSGEKMRKVGDKGAPTPAQMKRAKGESVTEEMKCPPATQDVKINTTNRDATIKNFNYGPLNVDEPGDYWKDIAKYWKTTEEAAKKSQCGNCVAFDISPRMDECMPGETSDDDGRLGYCWMHHFKCHSARSCHTWAKGGPITEDEKSYDWQKRAKMDERKLTDGEKDKLKSLEKDVSKKDFIDRYGKEEGESIYYATLTKMAKKHAEEMSLKSQDEIDEEFLDEKIAGLVKKSDKSGVPYGILKKVYDRGMAAWRTGHRPGTTPQQWAFARVNSFLTGGGARKSDADLWSKAKGAKKKKKESYEIGKDYGDHARKITPGQQVTKESIEEWYLSESVRDKYEQRYGDEWLSKLTKTYHAMIEKVEPCCDDCAEQFDHIVEDAEYQGRKVKLNDPIRTSENPNKKFKVYVKNEKGKVVVVRFGDPNMSINRDDPERRKSFRARHNCDDPGPKTKARYWSCFQWRAGAKVDN